MATVRQLLVRLGVKTDARGLARFDRRVDAAKRNMAGLLRGVGLVTAGLALAGFAFLKTARDAATYGDEVAKAGKRTGTTSEEYQELSFAADRAGASMSDVETGLQRQARSADDARQGLETAALAYRRLGIDVDDLNSGLSQVELFERVADGLKGISSEGEKIALAQQIFGRGGAKLLPLLSEGAAGIQELRMEARRLGLVMSDTAAAQSEEFVDSMTDLSAIMTGLRNTIGLALIPTLTQAIDRFSAWVLTNRDWIQQRAERIEIAFGRLLLVIRRANDAVKEIGGWGRIFRGAATALALSGLLRSFLALGSVISAVVSGIAALGGVVAGGGFLAGLAVLAVLLAGVASWLFLLSPLIAVVVGLVLAVNDLFVFLRGGDSLIGRFLERMGLTEEAMTAITRIVRAASRVFSELLDVTQTLGSIIGRLLTDAFTGLFEAIRPVLELIDMLAERFLGIQLSSFIDQLGSVADVLDLIADGLAKTDAFLEALDVNLGRQRQLAVSNPAGLGSLATGRLGAAAAQTFNNQQTTIRQSTPITINGAQDPAAVGAEVERVLQRANRELRAKNAGGER